MPFSRRAYTFMTVMPLLLALVVGGCSPKRVTRRADPVPAPRSESERPARETPPNPATSPRQDSPVADLPPPTPRGRTGARAPDRGDPSGSALGREAMNLAREQLGKPYQWGAAGPEKFDCSGLVCYVFGQLGVPLPRVSRDQARAGAEINRGELRPGDLVFFATEGGNINHVGIYVGGSGFIHAPRRHLPVREDSLNDAYWRRRYRTSRRVS